MKRLLWVLALLLVFTGCAAADPESMAPTGDDHEPTATTGPAIYDPTHPVETETDGAVRVFALEDGCGAVAAMGDYVVLFYANTLRSYTGDALHLAGERELQTYELPDYPDVQFNGEAMAYYDEVDHAVVTLNGTLKETGRVKIHTDIQGTFVLSKTLDTVYYCTTDSIRGLNLKTGNSHMLRQQGYDAQSLVLGCFGGEILGCEVYNRDKQYLSYISAETGELLGTSQSGLPLQTGGEFYFTQVSDGEVTDYLFGKSGEKPGCFRPAQHAQVIPALEMGGVITAQQSEENLVLDYYDLETGRRLSAVTLNGVGTVIHGTWADDAKDCLWLLVGDEAGASKLCRWDSAKAAVEDTAVYTGPRYTADNPDTQGLANCAQQAEALGSKYAVQIRIGNAPEGCPYELMDEYQVSLLESALEVLDTALSRYPDEVLAGINGVSKSGKVTITLVRDIDGERGSVQYWSGKDACIVLELGENLRGRLDNAMYHVLDTYLFNKTSVLDQWSELNPKGFKYDMNETDHLYRQEDDRLSGDSRAFADSFSMSYPIEDRAAVFQYAMSDEAAEVFTSKTMQQKLKTLGTAIRAAFGWKKVEDTFLWEQHLDTPIAYKPKK